MSNNDILAIASISKQISFRKEGGSGPHMDPSLSEGFSWYAGILIILFFCVSYLHQVDFMIPVLHTVTLYVMCMR